MNDNISRAELFDQLATITAEDANEMKAKIYAVIQEMETAPPKVIAQVQVDTDGLIAKIKEDYDLTEGWIPCSERLPRKNGTYLVTFEWTGKTGNKYIEIEGIDFERGRWSCHDYEKVTAWMPLPDPYESEEENE